MYELEVVCIEGGLAMQVAVKTDSIMQAIKHTYHPISHLKVSDI